MSTGVSATTSPPLRIGSPGTLAAGGALILLVVYAFAPTFLQLVATWTHDVSYQHCWLIPVISLAMIWPERARLASLPIQPSLSAAVLLLLVSMLWLVAYLADVRVIAQYAAVASIPIVLIMVMGWQLWRLASYPIAFLLLAVPVGEALIPVLMEFTADFTIMALQLTGVPVYRSGFYFATPTGLFEVAQSCSGIRYLMAAVTTSAMLAYFMYHSAWRRAALIGISVIVAIVANGIRAYTIVVIAHVSEMRYAVGVDHFVYGWVLFALVIAIVYWIGTKLREREPARTDDEPTIAIDNPGRGPSSGKLITVLASALVVLILVPRLAQTATNALDTQAAVEHPALALPAARGGWSGPHTGEDVWRPGFSGASDVANGSYRKGLVEVSVYVAQYGGAQAEMITASNRIQGDREEAGAEFRKREVTLADGRVLEIGHALLGDPGLGGVRVVWYWYEIGERRTASAAAVKGYELVGLARGAREAQRVYAVSVLSGGQDRADEVLSEFLTEHLPGLQQCTGTKREQPASCAGSE